MSAGAKYRLMLLERWEAKLSPAQKAVWTTLMDMLPKDSGLVGLAGGYGLECFLVGHVMRGASAEQLRKFVPKSPRADHRMAQAGERESVLVGSPRGDET